MRQVTSLIRTKFHQPFTRPHLVHRLRLQELIKEGLLGPLTLIIAPTGFGKTTLVASSLTGFNAQVAWLSLDREDNQPGRFLTYLTAALQNIEKKIGAEAAQLIAGMQQALPEAVITSLINDLDASGTEMVLVLDDYQFISAPEVHDAVTFLLDHCPLTFHLLIATRSDPPLPLAHLRAHGQLVELRAADLRFTETEAAQFLNDVMGLHLDSGSIAALEKRTEGWVAGLQMAALSMRDRKDVSAFIEGFSGTNRHVLDYLLEEVLVSQPPEIQHFLLTTSILERLTAPLSDALLMNLSRSGSGDATGEAGVISSPPANSAGILRYLERENLFLVPLDDETSSTAGTHWFRYHHLFADLLRACQQQAYPDRIPLLHRRASAWFEQEGFYPEAIHHLLAAGEDNRAADLIERHGPAHWAESDLSVIQMADRLPCALIIDRPKIGLYQAWLQINRGQVEKALPLLQALAGAAPEGRWPQTFVRLALAFLIRPASSPDQDLLPAEQAIDEIPATEPVLRDAAEILYGMALARRGDIDRAAEFSSKAIQRQKASIGTQTIPTLVPFLATVSWFQGRLHATAALCREYLAPIKEKGIRVSTAGNLDVILGAVLFDLNYLEEAEEHIRSGLKANEPWGNIMTDAFGLLALTHVLMARGDHAGAMQVVEQFETRLQAPSRPREFAEDFHTLRIRLQLAGGDLQAASHWADRTLLGEDYHRHPDDYRITLACIRLAQGRYRDVEALLSAKPTQDLAGNRIARQIETGLLLAAASAGQQHLVEAFGLVASCLDLAEPEGYVRVFLEAGEPAQELLTAYLRQPVEPVHGDFARKVLAAFSPPGSTGDRGQPPAGLIEPLSERELEVLRLMALGRTNQGIAGQLILAPGTIKAHAASIFRKLDVANRTEAVVRSRQLGLLA